MGEEIMPESYQICSRCIMDTTIPDIEFDDRGVCNYCHRYDNRIKRELHNDETGTKKLEAVIADMKRRGANHEYDCIVGVSGGVDSTYVAWMAKKIGLRPLAVHLDNGWDSELSVDNIEHILKILNIDLYTYVLDWEEFKDLQVAFLKSSIANAEIPTDQAILALLFKTAASKNIPYILSGSNIVTEGVLPTTWMYTSRDLRLLRAIHRRFGKGKLTKYPKLSITDFLHHIYILGIKFFPILNYTPYVKKEAKALLSRELGWRDYGGKHYESIYTRFFQGYILPRKFGIDKRIAHLSTLTLSGQMTRDEAIEEMKKEPYPPELQLRDKEYVIKKLGLTEREFDDIMSAPPKTYLDYPNNNFLWERFAPLVEMARQRAIHNVRRDRWFHKKDKLKTNIHIYPCNFKNQSRIERQTRSCAEAGLVDRIYLVGLWEPGLLEHEYLDEQREVWRCRTMIKEFGNIFILKPFRYFEWQIKSLMLALKVTPVFVNCHSLPVLPFGIMLKVLTGAKVVYDTHELETESVATKGFRRPIFKALEWLLVRFVDATIVVNGSIAEWYIKKYHLKNISVVRNVPSQKQSKTGSNNSRYFRDKFNLNNEDILFIYHGALEKGRGLELLLEVFSEAGGCLHIVFMGYGALTEMIKAYQEKFPNIHFQGAVSPYEVVKYASGADIGISLIENVCLSYYLSLPNKIFEYIFSDLPVIVSDFPEMSRIIDESECGWKVPVDKNSFSRLIKGISKEAIEMKKKNTMKYRQTISWANEEKKLLQVYRTMASS